MYVSTPCRSQSQTNMSPDNHKSTSTSSAPGKLNLRSASDSSSFELSYTDQSDRYEYAGTRTSGDGQYVLIFDKIAQHFVLHRVDSTFDMNLISAPWQSDAEELRSQYPQLDPQPKANPAPATTTTSQPPQKKVTKLTKAAAAPRSVPAVKAAPKRTKVEKPKKKVKEPTPEPEVDDDSDDGLTIEYPGGKPPERFTFNSTPVFQRAPSESDEDEEVAPRTEDRNQDVDMLHLPSPAANGGERSEEEMELDLEAELEAELEAAFEEEADRQDSDESEEE
jgi:hypothetical protein